MVDLLSLPSRHARPGSTEFLPVVAAAVGMLVVAFLTKHGCTALGFGESFYCFSDYGPVFDERALAGGRFPYDASALEYPAGLGLLLWLAAAISDSAAGFVRVNIWLAAMAALAVAWMLWRLAGRRALLFAAAPSLALYAFLNWDLVALVWAVGGLLAFLRRRDGTAGALLGMGASIKVFPVLFLLPLAAQRWGDGDRAGVRRLLMAAAIAIIVVNAPIAWTTFDGWSNFLRFNTERPVDWGTLWSAGCHALGSDLCADVRLVNGLSLAAFAAVAVLIWWWITRWAPVIPRWQLAFPLLVAFFLTNKVYSPQYSLWILPWFALALPGLPLFLAYAAIDIGIYVTTFAWQQHLTGAGGLPLWPLHVFVVLRAVMLITMVARWARGGQ